MKIARLKVLGSSYIGLFLVANDELCFVPKNIDSTSEKKIEETLDVKVVKASIQESSLLAVFSKMNNKKIILPKGILSKEIDVFEREIKVMQINTEKAIGNLIELNDNGALVSKSIEEKAFEELKKLKINLIRTNVAGVEATGSSVLATSKGFLMNPDAKKEDIINAEKAFRVKGGFSTANTGDKFVRNSVIANAKGILAGDLTTGFELNRIEEALEG